MNRDRCGNCGDPDELCKCKPAQFEFKMYIATCKDDESDTDSIFIINNGMCITLFTREHPDGAWKLENDMVAEWCSLKDWKEHWKVKRIEHVGEFLREIINVDK